MTFKAKVDSYYIKFIVVIILVLALVMFFPLFMGEIYNSLVIAIILFIFIASVSFILWSTLSIVYIFKDNYLFVRGGPFRSKIDYKEITEVRLTTAIFTGYRVMSAKEGIEVSYKKSLLGSVKISPAEQRAFIEELIKRCPHIEVHIY